MIVDFRVGDEITAFFVVAHASAREFRDRAKGEFLELELRDASGDIKAISFDWKGTPRLDDLFDGAVVKIQATVDEYNEKLNLKIKQVRRAKEDEYDLAQLLPVSAESEESVRARLAALIAQIENPHILALVNAFFGEDTTLREFLRASAAEKNHHAYVRGLAEHTCNVAEIVVTLAPRFPFLDKDILIFGGLMHDYGKVASYEITSFIDRTLEGELLDHIAIADAEITAKAKSIEGFPPELLTRLRHVILAHHGKREFGSPVFPRMGEALLLNLADQIDAWMGILRDQGAKIDYDGWTERLWMLERQAYYFTPEAMNKNRPDGK